MSNEKKFIPSDSGGFVGNLTNYVKLVWRLLKDNRVTLYLKAIPFISLIYLINPIDIPGPIDDATVLWLLTYMFIELCPSDVVEEHRQAINKEIIGRWNESEASDIDEEDIIDAEYQDEQQDS